jgi:hypothetical protein
MSKSKMPNMSPIKALIIGLGAVFVSAGLAIMFQNCGSGFTGVTGDLSSNLGGAGTIPVIADYTGRTTNDTVTVTANQPLNLSVTAINAVSFQWFKNGTPIANATGPALSRSAAQSSDAGTYLIIAGNAYGTTNVGLRVVVDPGGGGPTITPTPTPTPGPDPGPSAVTVTAIRQKAVAISRGPIGGNFTVTMAGTNLTSVKSIRFPVTGGQFIPCSSIASQTATALECQVGQVPTIPSAFNSMAEFYSDTNFATRITVANVPQFSFAPVLSGLAASVGLPIGTKSVNQVIGSTEPILSTQNFTLTFDGSGFSGTNNVVFLRATGTSTNINPRTTCQVQGTTRLICEFASGLASNRYEASLLSNGVESLIETALNNANARFALQVQAPATPAATITSVTPGDRPQAVNLGPVTGFQLLVSGSNLSAIRSARFVPSNVPCTSVVAATNGESVRCTVAPQAAHLVPRFYEAQTLEIFTTAQPSGTPAVRSSNFRFRPVIRSLSVDDFGAPGVSPKSGASATDIIGSSQPLALGITYPFTVTVDGLMGNISNDAMFLSSGSITVSGTSCTYQSITQLRCDFRVASPGLYDVRVQVNNQPAVWNDEANLSGTASIKVRAGAPQPPPRSP